MTSKETIVLGGKTHPVVGYVKAPQDEIIGKCGVVPAVDMKLMSDFRWQLNVLMDRIKDPDKYRDNLGEDVDATIERLTVWVKEHIAEADNLKNDEKAFLSTLIGEETVK